MRKLLLPVLAFAAAASMAQSRAPLPGDVMQARKVDLWLPGSDMAAMQAKGVVFDGGGHYQTVLARFWYLPDGGPDVGPVLPPGTVILGGSAPMPCPKGLCLPHDGGVDVMVAQAGSCFCAVDATCTAVPPGGAKPTTAPMGFTLPGGGWTSPSGAGCMAKTCADLFTTLADGGSDTSWPSVCPLK